MSRESRIRTVAKAISWQVLGLFTTSAVGFAMTGSLVKAGSFAITTAIVGFACFFAHERLWLSIPWGRAGT